MSCIWRARPHTDGEVCLALTIRDDAGEIGARHRAEDERAARRSGPGALAWGMRRKSTIATAR